MKFTPIEEKERIGKRRKLSREDEARNTVTTKNKTSFTHVSSHVNRLQSGGGLQNGPDLNFKIYISSLKRIRRHQEDSESPIRSMSSDTMLSSFEDVDEGDIFAEQNEQRSRTQCNMNNRSVSNSFVHGPDMQTYSVQDLDNLKREMLANSPANDDHIRSSPMPVLHRFTLDDQVLAERLANSQIEAESSESHRPDRFAVTLNQGMFKHLDKFDNAAPNSSPRNQSIDKHTNLSGSHKSYLTDSDTLPQTQKISRQLRPSQSQMARNVLSEAKFETPRVTSRILSGSEPVIKDREPITLFGQEIYSSDKGVNPVASERPFQSNTHGYMASPRGQPVSTPRAVNHTTARDSVTGGHSTSDFRLPSPWTPHRTILQLNSYDETRQRVDVPTSPVVISHRGPSPFISTLSRGNYRTRQLPFSARGLSKTAEDTRAVEGHEGIYAPVFKTPFRR